MRRHLPNLALLAVLTACDPAAANGAHAMGVSKVAAHDDSKPDEDPSAKEVYARYRACTATCDSLHGSDAVTCRLNCAGSIAAEIESLSTDERVCVRPCLIAAAKCTAPCESKPDAEEATCRLLCRSEATSCLRRCQDA